MSTPSVSDAENLSEIQRVLNHLCLKKYFSDSGRFSVCDALFIKAQEAQSYRAFVNVQVAAASKALEISRYNLDQERVIYEIKLNNLNTNSLGQIARVADICGLVFSCINTPFINVSALCNVTSICIGRFNLVVVELPLQVAIREEASARIQYDTATTAFNKANKASPDILAEAYAAEALAREAYLSDCYSMIQEVSPPFSATTGAMKTTLVRRRATNIVRLAGIDTSWTSVIERHESQLSADILKDAWKTRTKSSHDLSTHLSNLIKSLEYCQQHVPDADAVEAMCMHDLYASFVTANMNSQQASISAAEANVRKKSAQLSVKTVRDTMTDLSTHLTELENMQLLPLTSDELLMLFRDTEEQHVLIKQAKTELQEFQEQEDTAVADCAVLDPIASRLLIESLEAGKLFYASECAMRRKLRHSVFFVETDQSIYNEFWPVVESTTSSIAVLVEDPAAVMTMDFSVPALASLVEAVSSTTDVAAQDYSTLAKYVQIMLNSLVSSTDIVSHTQFQATLSTVSSATTAVAHTSRASDMTAQLRTSIATAAKRSAAMIPSASQPYWNDTIKQSTEVRRTLNYTVSECTREAQHDQNSTEALQHLTEAKCEQYDWEIRSLCLEVCRSSDAATAALDNAIIATDKVGFTHYQAEAIAHARTVISTSQTIFTTCKAAFADLPDAPRRLKASWTRVADNAERDIIFWQEKLVHISARVFETPVDRSTRASRLTFEHSQAVSRYALNRQRLKSVFGESVAALAYKNAQAETDIWNAPSLWEGAIVAAEQAVQSYALYLNALTETQLVTTDEDESMALSGTVTETECLVQMWDAKQSWFKAHLSASLAQQAQRTAERSSPDIAVSEWDTAIAAAKQVVSSWTSITGEYTSRRMSSHKSLTLWFDCALEDVVDFKLMWTGKVVLCEACKAEAVADLADYHVNQAANEHQMIMYDSESNNMLAYKREAEKAREEANATFTSALTIMESGLSKAQDRNKITIENEMTEGRSKQSRSSNHSVLILSKGQVQQKGAIKKPK